MSNNSDIFDKYAELALERGLISNADAKEKLEKNPRADSQDISTIEALYGVKPNQSKNMDYKKNIVEIAHPNAVVVSPSHDKLNGLVENLNERNNILINIVNKTPNGNLTGHKYASDELVRSLVRVANDMDNKNIDELRILADKCLEQINKKAYWQIAVPAVAALLGGIYLQQHLDMANIGLEENGKRLISELEDFLGDHLIGTDYTENFQNTINQIIDRVKLILSQYNSFKDKIDELQKPKTFEELEKYTEQKKDFANIFIKFNALVSKSNTLFNQIEKRFADQSYKQMQKKEVGIGEKINRFFGGIFSGDKYSLVADDFKDVLRALAPFRESLKSLSDLLKEADKKSQIETKDLEAKFKADIEQKPYQVSETGAPSTIPVSSKSDEPGRAELMATYKDL